MIDIEDEIREIMHNEPSKVMDDNYVLGVIWGFQVYYVEYPSAVLGTVTSNAFIECLKAGKLSPAAEILAIRNLIVA